MYTQCPECLSIYEISDEQLRQSRGNVQCGVCNTRFRAQVRLAASLKSPIFERSKKKTAPSTPAPEKPANKQATKRQIDPSPGGAETRDSAKTVAAKPQRPQPRPPESPAKPPQAQAAPKVGRPASPQTPPAATKSAPGDQPDLTDWELATIDAEAGMEPLIKSPSADSPDQRHQTMPAMLDGDAGQARLWRWLLIGLVGLAALALLAQTVWLIRQPLAQIPVLGSLVRPWCGAACQQTSSAEDVGQWQIADRRIHAHPRVDGVILVEVTIRNAGEAATAYPALRLRLLDEGNNVVAERTLLPDAYMQELRPGDRLSAGALLPLSVALEAPRHGWSHYEIELLASVVL